MAQILLLNDLKRTRHQSLYLNEDARSLGRRKWDVVHEAGDVSAETEKIGNK